MKIVFTILAAFLINFTLFSQTWQNIANKNWIYSINKDSVSLWLGTSGGLVKLNKQTKQTITYDRANKRIPDNNVMTLNVRYDDSLWIGSRFSGIGFFNNNQCVTFNTDNSNIPHDQFNSSIIIDNSGNKYIGSLGWVSKFNNGIFQIIKQMDILVPFDCIYDMKIDSLKNVWIASYQGLFKYNGNLCEKITDIMGTAYSIAVDKNNKIWVGTDNGLYYYNGVSWSCYNMGNSGLPFNVVLKLCFDFHNNLWINSWDKLTCFSSTGIWTTYPCTSQNGNNFAISTLFNDSDSNLWVGTRKNGLILFNNGIFNEVGFTQPSVLPSNDIKTIAFAHNKVWFGFYDYGLFCYHNQQYIHWDTTNSNLSCQKILHISPDNLGNIWLITHKNTTSLGQPTNFTLIKFDGTQFEDMNIQFNEGSCRAFKIAPNGIFWIGTSKGLYKWDGSNLVFYSLNNSPLSSDVINCIDFDSSGNIWIGQNGCWDDFGHLIGGGLIKYDGINNWQEYNIFNSQLPYNTIKAIKVDNNDIVWLGTVNDGAYDGGGLTRFNGTNWQSYKKENSGISDNQVLTIDEDSDGEIWAGTMFGGLVGYDKISQWKVFKQSNSGIAYFLVSSIAIDNYDNIWMKHESHTGASVYYGNTININETSSDNEDLIQLYPNPAIDFINFNLNYDNCKILIINSIGQVVNKTDLTKGINTINIINFKKGIYFYMINDKKNKSIKNGKFIKG